VSYQHGPSHGLLELRYLALAKFSDRKFTDFLGEREVGGTMITGFDYPYF
jgi:hypothetical protein